MITQILLMYIITIRTTALYIIALALSVAPVLSNTLDTMPHRLLSFPIFLYKASQLVLL